MKFTLTIAISFFAAFSTSAQEAKADASVLPLTKGDEWEYEVMVEAPRGAKLPTGKDVTIKEVADGMVAIFKKTRTYVGKTKPKKDGEAFDTFAILRDKKPQLLEFAEITAEAIYARGSKTEGEKPQKPILMPKPLLMVSSKNKAGETWKVEGPEKDGKKSGFAREFRVFGKEKIIVPAGEFEAIRVEVHGQTGAVEIRRSYWFVPGLGFVKGSEELLLKKQTPRARDERAECFSAWGESEEIVRPALL